jgi:hypothetical protein
MALVRRERMSGFSRGGGGGSIRIKETDGSPSIDAVTEVRLPADMLVDVGGGVVSLPLGSAALVDTGTTAGDIPVLATGGKYPAIDGSLITNISGGGGDMVLLYSTTLSSPTASITTGTLPTGYKSLVIDTSLRTDGTYPSAAIYGYFNGDTTASNYGYQTMLAYGITVAAGRANVPYMLGATGTGAVTNFFGSDRVIIRNHEGTVNYKTWHTTETTIVGTNSFNRYCVNISGAWHNTDAITSVTIQDPLANDFIAGSFVAVYGIK